MCRDVFDHVSLLTERPVANIASKRLLTSVDLQMLFEVEPLAVDEQPADWKALVI